MADKKYSVNWNLVAGVAGAYFGWAYVIKPILDTLHITKSDQQIANENAPLTSDNPWSPAFYKNAPSGSWLITVASATALADKIHSFSNVFSDSFTQVFGVFQQLRTKSQVSFLCDIFQQNYGVSLYGFMQDPGGLSFPPFSWWDGLSQDHLTQLNTYVNNLPDYKI